MQNTCIKHMMDIDMFCNIHEGEEGGLEKGDNGPLKYSDVQTISMKIDEHMSHNEFRSRIYVIFNLQSNLDKPEFIMKFDPTSLIVLCNDTSFASML